MHDLKVWPGVEADSHWPSTTPGKNKNSSDLMSRLAKVCFELKLKKKRSLFTKVLEGKIYALQK